MGLTLSLVIAMEVECPSFSIKQPVYNKKRWLGDESHNHMLIYKIVWTTVVSYVHTALFYAE